MCAYSPLYAFYRADMANSLTTTPEGWVAHFLTPDNETERQLRYAGSRAVDLVACGRHWDAVVISPLERGLAALDCLDLPQSDGHAVVADYRRHELIVLVRPGTGSAGPAGVQGVRILSSGSWLLLPCGAGNWEAASLSQAVGALPRYVDPAALRAALLSVDEGRVACAH